MTGSDAGATVTELSEIIKLDTSTVSRRYEAAMKKAANNPAIAFSREQVVKQYYERIAESQDRPHSSSISRRERWLTGEPNGQVTRIPNATGIEVDVDYRCILCRDHTADDGSNSDIRADTGKESHYKRHKKAYGAVRALMPVIK